MAKDKNGNAEEVIDRVFEVAFALLDAAEGLRDGVLLLAAIGGVTDPDHAGVAGVNRAIRQGHAELMGLLVESGTNWRPSTYTTH